MSISADGGVVAIGDAKYDGIGSDSGRVRIFQLDGTSWVQVGQDIEGEAASDWNGYSVSLSADGTVVAIGASYNDGNHSNTVHGNAGHVRVFQYDGTSSWSQVGQDIDGER